MSTLLLQSTSACACFGADCSYILLVIMYWAYHFGWKTCKTEKVSLRRLTLVLLLMSKGGSHVTEHRAAFMPAQFPALDWIPRSEFVSIWKKKTTSILFSSATLLNVIHPPTVRYIFKQYIFILIMVLVCGVDKLWGWHANSTFDKLWLLVQPLTEPSENCASDSIVGYLLTVVAKFRMKEIRHGWVLLLTFLASGREWVPGCICSINERHLKWDRGWQLGQVEETVQDTQMYHALSSKNEEEKNDLHILWI